MEAKELAAKLNGCEYGDEIDPALEREAKTHGLVVAFGASDDLMEFRGAIHDEIGCYGGEDVFVDDKGLLESFDDVRDRASKEKLREWFQREPRARKIEAIWDDDDGYSWCYATEIPHAQFDVMEDGEKYCRGIVFRLADAVLPAMP